MQINDDSPESEIVDRPKVKTTGAKVIEIQEGSFDLLAKSSAYVAIPLKVAGTPTIEVKEPNGNATRALWEKGSLVYMTRDCLLTCDGLGTVLCIILAMSYGNE
jgi:hypothetical protein